MTWLTISVASYFFTALANIGDKLLVSKYISQPSVYAFYVGCAQVLVLVLIPFGVQLPGNNFQIALTLLELCAGVLFIAALTALYAGLQEGEASRVIPIIGGITPLVTLGLAAFFLGERLGAAEITALALLVLGIIVIAYERERHRTNNYRYAEYAVASGFLFAASYTLSKYVFSVDGWINGFFWMRMGSVLAALLLLVPRYQRARIAADFAKPKETKSGLILATQCMGAAGFVLLNYALSLGSVTIITGLQALQYLFVFALTAVLGARFCELRERYTPVILGQKLGATFLIALGLYFLTR